MIDKFVLPLVALVVVHSSLTACSDRAEHASDIPQSPRASDIATSDGAITKRVEQALGSNSETRELGIQVMTRDRVVSLSGRVPSSSVRENVGQLVRGMQGVRNVHNYLVVSDKP